MLEMSLEGGCLLHFTQLLRSHIKVVPSTSHVIHRKNAVVPAIVIENYKVDRFQVG